MFPSGVERGARLFSGRALTRFLGRTSQRVDTSCMCPPPVGFVDQGVPAIKGDGSRRLRERSMLQRHGCARTCRIGPRG